MDKRRRATELAENNMAIAYPKNEMQFTSPEIGPTDGRASYYQALMPSSHICHALLRYLCLIIFEKSTTDTAISLSRES